MTKHERRKKLERAVAWARKNGLYETSISLVDGSQQATIDQIKAAEDMLLTAHKKGRPSRSRKLNYVTLAAKVFPGWENEVGPTAAKAPKGLSPLEAVKWAGEQHGLGRSDMAQEFGGLLGK